MKKRPEKRKEELVKEALKRNQALEINKPQTHTWPQTQDTTTQDFFCWTVNELQTKQHKSKDMYILCISEEEEKEEDEEEEKDEEKEKEQEEGEEEEEEEEEEKEEGEEEEALICPQHGA